MPLARIRYRPNHSEFGKMLMSDQTRDLAMEAAKRMRELAQRIAGDSSRASGDLPSGYTSAFKAEEGPVTVLGGNPRRTARVVNDHPLASIIEFGSGVLSEGENAGKPRRQGGYSRPHRILGRVAAALGNPPNGA